MVSGNQSPKKMMNSSRGFETCTWCMCHWISVIIYSDTLMLPALARGPFTLCAFNLVRTVFCVMPLHFWRDCVTGLPYTLPVVFMTSCYCKFWHINEGQTCCTPKRRVLLLHSWQTAMHQCNDATRRSSLRGDEQIPLDAKPAALFRFTLFPTTCSQGGEHMHTYRHTPRHSGEMIVRVRWRVTISVLGWVYIPGWWW